mmetsp:Transcript_33716/g.77039  ORF Transcript_33716/g.77039 Transcript_33716/m.77039 type:complete len:278 (-) Transcript_33716:1150-1983(-)
MTTHSPFSSLSAGAGAGVDESASITEAETWTESTAHRCSSCSAIRIGSPNRWYRGWRRPSTPAKTTPLEIPMRHRRFLPFKSRCTSNTLSILCESRIIAPHRSAASAGSRLFSHPAATYASPIVSILNSPCFFTSRSNAEKMLLMYPMRRRGVFSSSAAGTSDASRNTLGNWTSPFELCASGNSDILGSGSPRDDGVMMLRLQRSSTNTTTMRVSHEALASGLSRIFRTTLDGSRSCRISWVLRNSWYARCCSSHLALRSISSARRYARPSKKAQAW